MRISDWSSDVCSSDLRVPGANVSLRDLRRWRDLRSPSRNRALRRLRQADFDRTRRSDRADGREQAGGDLETEPAQVRVQGTLEESIEVKGTRLHNGRGGDTWVSNGRARRTKVQ